MTAVRTTTSDFNFNVLNFNAPLWGDELNDNWIWLDRVLSAITGGIGISGPWTHSTDYLQGDRVIDELDNSLFEVLVTHTTPASGTFTAYRQANPTYYRSLDFAPRNRGTWANGIRYNRNEVVLSEDGNLVGIVLNNHTSVTSYATGVANGNIQTLLDVSAFTAEALSDLAFKDKINNDDWAGTPLSVTNGGTGVGSVAAIKSLLGLGSFAYRNNLNANEVVTSIIGDRQVTSNKIALLNVLEGHIPDHNIINRHIAHRAINWYNMGYGQVLLEALAAEVTRGLVPIGSVIAFAGASAPTGFLLCNSAAFGYSSYPLLAAVIGSHYGGDWSTYGHVPDLRGMMPVGRFVMDSGQNGPAARGFGGPLTHYGGGHDSLNCFIGMFQHTLTGAEIPAHAHYGDYYYSFSGTTGIDSPDHTHTYSYPIDKNVESGTNASAKAPTGATSFNSGGASARHAHGFSGSGYASGTSQNTGGSGAHNNAQPGLIMNYIIRAF